MAMTDAGRAWLDAKRVADSTDPRQLELNLPWGGRSPRVLTRAYERFTLRREALPLDEDAATDEQYRRFLSGS